MFKSIGILNAFIRRDFLEQNRYAPAWIKRIVSIFFEVYTTYFIAQLFNGNPSLDAYGGSYFEYAIIGGVIYQLIYALVSALPRVIDRAQYQGTLEPLLTSPSPLWLILIGACSYNTLFEFLNIILFITAAWIVKPPVFAAQPHWGIVSIVIILHILAAWAIGIISASLVLAYKVVTPLESWILSACSFLAGYFYPISIMPEFLQTVAALFPFTYGIQALRLAIQGQILWSAIAIFSSFTIVLLILAYWSFPKSLVIARHDGTLTYQ